MFDFTFLAGVIKESRSFLFADSPYDTINNFPDNVSQNRLNPLPKQDDARENQTFCSERYFDTKSRDLIIKHTVQSQVSREALVKMNGP